MQAASPYLNLPLRAEADAGAARRWTAAERQRRLDTMARLSAGGFSTAPLKGSTSPTAIIACMRSRPATGFRSGSMEGHFAIPGLSAAPPRYAIWRIGCPKRVPNRGCMRTGYRC